MLCCKNVILLSRSLRKLSGTRYSSSYKEVSIQVPWGHVAGKWWGPYDVRPVLAIHGWQDNCGSFDRLVPLLNQNVGFLAIDLPGHGLSSRLPPGMYYQYINYLITIRLIMKYFRWPKMSLIGHSLGGIISYTYTMMYPSEVDFLICLDGAKPLIAKNFNANLSKAVDGFLKYNEFSSDSKEPPSYTMDEIKKKIILPNSNSILMEYSHYIIERNVAPSKLYPGKYYFTRDPRLKTGALTNFSQSQLIEYAQYMTGPMFVAKTTSGSYYEPKKFFYEVLDVLKRTSSDCDFHYVEGTHHTHLNNPEVLADLIKKFIQRHNTEDRSEGGINKDIILDNEKPGLIHL